MNKPSFTIGVFAIIINNEDKVLLCHRTDYDLWNLPGGFLEHGETPWDGVIREVKEETGLSVQVDGLVGIYSKPDKNDIVFQFICSVSGGSITLNKEADKIEFFSLENIPKNTSPKQVDRIKYFFINPKKLIMKKQVGKSSFQLIEEDLL